MDGAQVTFTSSPWTGVSKVMCTTTKVQPYDLEKMAYDAFFTQKLEEAQKSEELASKKVKE
jgi:hypothetical protein